MLGVFGTIREGHLALEAFDDLANPKAAKRLYSRFAVRTEKFVGAFHETEVSPVEWYRRVWDSLG
jgi:hypothetical protein